MNLSLILIALAGLFLLGIFSFLARKASVINKDYFKKRWHEIDNLASDKTTWFQAVVEGDKLLDEALKQSRYGGKTTADRMVQANRAFTNPDAAWRAHKIRNKVVHESDFKLKKSLVNQAMSGFKRALKDLGAL